MDLGRTDNAPPPVSGGPRVCPAPCRSSIRADVASAPRQRNASGPVRFATHRLGPATARDRRPNAPRGVQQDPFATPRLLTGKPDVAFECKKLFKGAKVDEVFDAVLEWLAKKGAKIKKADKPTLIEALYGREDVTWNWDKELKRTVDFEFVTSKEYVGIGVYQSPTRRTVKRVLESPFQANITWRDWLNECWEHVQGKVAPAPAAPGTPMRIPTAKAVAEGAKGPPPPAPKATPPAPKPPGPAKAAETKEEKAPEPEGSSSS